jgi:2-haloacid dehalogenase
MIKAVIFDCFGVLVGDGWLPYKRKYFAQDDSLFEQATNLNQQVDAGLSSYDGFIQSIADLAGRPYLEAKREIEQNPPQEELFGYIAKELKPSYKIGMLSNAGADFLPTLFTSEQIKLFDAVALSFETGVIKPDERAYEIIAERLAVEPAECVFIDDQERFVTAAKEVGMEAIHFQSFEQMQADLEKILA